MSRVGLEQFNKTLTIAVSNPDGTTSEIGSFQMSDQEARRMATSGFKSDRLLVDDLTVSTSNDSIVAPCDVLEYKVEFKRVEMPDFNGPGWIRE